MRWNDLSETLHTIDIFNYTEYVALWEELLQYATCHIYSTENLLCRQVVQWVCWILWAYIWQTKINDLRLCKSSYLRNISSLNGKITAWFNSYESPLTFTVRRGIQEGGKNETKWQFSW